MAVEITPEDLTAFGINLDPKQAALLISGALATARLSAPCLARVAPDSDEAQSAKLVLLGSIARCATSGNAQGVDTQSAGPFSVKFAPYSGKMLSDAEKRQLREICSPNRGRAFSLDTTPGSANTVGWFREDATTGEWISTDDEPTVSDSAQEWMWNESVENELRNLGEPL